MRSSSMPCGMTASIIRPSIEISAAASMSALEFFRSSSVWRIWTARWLWERGMAFMRPCKHAPRHPRFDQDQSPAGGSPGPRSTHTRRWSEPWTMAASGSPAAGQYTPLPRTWKPVEGIT